MKNLNYNSQFRSIHKKPSFLITAAAVSLAVISLTAQAGKITSVPAATDALGFTASGFGGWNLDNVEVVLNGTQGDVLLDVLNSWFDELTGAYNFAPDSDFTYQGNVDDGLGTIMGYTLAKDWPVGEPSGIKIVNDDSDVKLGKPTNCIMATSYLADHFLDSGDPIQVTCSGPFQSHKRYKLAMLPTTVDGAGSESVDLVFNVEDEAGSRDYQVFQKINNWTDGRLEGFTIQVGFGVGDAFTAAGPTNPNLYLTVPSAIWSPTQLANFSEGLFGPFDDNTQTLGFFDPVQRAGFLIAEYVAAPGTSEPTDTLHSAGTLGSDYAQIPPLTGPASQFGPWLPNSMLPSGIFFDDDGNPETDAQLLAWYGWNPDLPVPGLGWMSGSQGFDNDPATPGDAFEAIPDAEIVTMGENLSFTMDVIDDLVNVGLNYIVTVGDVSSFPAPTFTIRITPTADTSGIPAPAFVGEIPDTPLLFTSSDAEVLLEPNPGFVVGSLLTARVGDADLNQDPLVAETVTVSISSTSGLLDQAFMLTELGNNRGVFAATLPEEYSNVAVGTQVSMSYLDVNTDVDLLTVENETKTSTTTATTDAGLIQFNPATYAVIESDGNVVLTVERIGGSVGEVTVEYNTVSDTAIGNEDYTPVTGTLTFGDGDTVTSKSIPPVPLLDDATNEATESFNVILSNAQGGAALVVAASNAQVDIADDDDPLVQFNSAAYNAAENGGSVTLSVARNGTAGTLDVDYASADVSATDGADYSAVTGTLSFLDGEGSKDVVVTLLDDTTFEGDESFSVTLSNPTAGALGA
ncbi:MAG: choice-of-anchor F family protein, partial [Gammaproteobacteria bacterium]|nr:choice-of-anchor F family protein [Gammaproteobacteria bacterium]